MAMADTDGDGLISLAEFARLGNVLQDIASLKKSLGIPAGGGGGGGPAGKVSVEICAQAFQVRPSKCARPSGLSCLSANGSCTRVRWQLHG